MQSERFRDQLSIDTPEQVSLDFPVSGLGSRALAILVDSVIQTAAYVVLGIVFALLWRPIDHYMTGISDGTAKWILGGFVLLNFLLLWGYFTCFEAFWHGQTPGKRLLKIRVLKDTGRQITFFEALARNLLRIIDALPTAYIIGIVSVLVSRENKRLGDLLAGTIVVHVNADNHAATLSHADRNITAGFAPAQTYAAVAPASVFPQDALTRLTPEDLHLVESFSARSTDLDHDTSERLARQILERLCQKMQLAPPADVSSRRALDSLAADLRTTLATTRS